MEEVSVWIQTYKRPEMLRTALRSVASQTTRQSIREVVVIENGEDARSREVCAEFPELPITYVCREKSLTPGSLESSEAGKQVLRGLNTRLAAILHDDDWWAPEHLERALKNIALTPGCVASFCTCVWTTGESGHLIGLLDDYICWFATGGRRTAGCWVLSLPDLVVASQIATTFHYSSMVVDKEVYVACLESIGHENPFDTDRILAVELGFHGQVICDSTPRVFVRIHPMTESKRLERSGEAKRWFIHTTNRILERASSRNLNFQEEFAARLQSTDASLERIRNISHLQNIDYLVKTGVLDKRFRRRSKPWHYMARTARAVLPPALHQRVTKILHLSR